MAFPGSDRAARMRDAGLVAPIIVDEHGDLEAYHDLDTAESDLEAIDVRNDEYEAFDATGRRLSVTLRCERRRWLFGVLTATHEWVRIEPAVPSSHDAPDLGRRLRTYLAHFGPTESALEGMPLDALLAAFVARTGIR